MKVVNKVLALTLVMSAMSSVALANPPVAGTGTGEGAKTCPMPSSKEVKNLQSAGGKDASGKASAEKAN